LLSFSLFVAFGIWHKLIILYFDFRIGIIFLFQVLLSHKLIWLKHERVPLNLIVIHKPLSAYQLPQIVITIILKTLSRCLHSFISGIIGTIVLYDFVSNIVFNPCSIFLKCLNLSNEPINSLLSIFL
jgi:hypothetical protein